MKPRFFTRLDALLLALIVLAGSAVLFLSLHYDHSWGDDESAYLLEGIAISEGRFYQQSIENSMINHAGTPFYYVWGFPAVLSFVHRAVGFDRETFQSILFYKIPVAISLILMASLVYLYLRRRFSRLIAFTMTLPFFMHTASLELANQVMTDIPYAACCMACYLLADLFSGTSRRSTQLQGVLLGLMIYMTYLIRYAGSSLLIALAAMQVFRYIPPIIKKQARCSLPAFWGQISPYLTFVVLYLIVGRFMPYAKSEASAMQFSPAKWFVTFHYYSDMLRRFIMALFPLPRLAVTLLLPFLFVTGFVASFKKERFAAIFLVTTIAGLLALSYQQGIRYLFNILPLIFMFIIYGIQYYWRLITYQKHEYRIIQAKKILKALMATALIVALGIQTFQFSAACIRSNRHPLGNGMYSSSAIETYHFIRKAIPADKKIMTCKARALSLNTDRVCYQSWGSYFDAEHLDRQLDNMDYLLITNEIHPTAAETRFFAEPAFAGRLKPVFSSGPFALYQIN